VDLIIDASSIINLHNARALDLVAGLKGRVLWLSPLVVGECEPTCAAEILLLQGQSRLRFVDPDHISAEAFLDLLEAYDLGEGETECLALCSRHPYVLCCDDQRARNVATQLYGAERVVGSLRLLRWAAMEDLISAEGAFSYYSAMKEAGGFLPDIELAWFTEKE
jgi:predicted nucleic acid-binding protein